MPKETEKQNIGFYQLAVQKIRVFPIAFTKEKTQINQPFEKHDFANPHHNPNLAVTYM